ncbi:MAG TPA: DNA-directed RNA polymerase subunit omega [Candidatus Anaerobutyricum faecale]|uniref:DNA-directed RNA polymerase subunit omega n=1 Tax=Eubacterium sp. An11 TaxID=1965542 RepID=UPI000B39476F|nr:DNA-directed RNA polymerase subunit omega [Eubacterium sp. An11]OUQ64880.1 DNA-directed RNA polymerase subunit omega [Eubacterium sp. An11]HJC30537.1 DNA-directed RNA polymerase subunit omega [Candidatus Anaerobutyricum faecale]
MLHPSYTELMEKINSEEYRGEEPAINSRYSIVIATSKRARELIGGAKPLVDGVEGEKPLSIAVKELYDGKIKILQDDEEVDFDDSLDLDGEMDDIAEAGDEESDEIDFEGEAGEAGESTNETEE